MGRDNHRQRRSVERKTGCRDTYDRLLIVCEGEKTEPNYFKEIQQLYRLASANVKVLPSEYGTQPLKVVGYAYDYCKTDNRWEKVFCVFDRDDHPNFPNALEKAMAINRKLTNDQGRKIEFYAIPSNPCFELWFFLHFEEVYSAMPRQELFKKLKKYMPGYEKGEGGHFAQTKARLDTAYANASRLSRNRTGSRVRNPFTAVDDVVKALMKLALMRTAK